LQRILRSTVKNNPGANAKKVLWEEITEKGNPKIFLYLCSNKRLADYENAENKTSPKPTYP